ncbi:MAG: hypothetical protein R2912_03800 [Eubacteriales bacterium]
MPNSTQNLLSDQSDPVIVSRVNELLQSPESRVIIAIDGMCCAGKTTMTERLGTLLDANVFHLDDYFPSAAFPHTGSPEPARRKCGCGT